MKKKMHHTPGDHPLTLMVVLMIMKGVNGEQEGHITGGICTIPKM